MARLDSFGCPTLGFRMSLTSTLRAAPDGAAAPGGLPRRLVVHAVIAGAAFVAYILSRALAGPVSEVLTAVGVTACGWAWLLTRAIFDPAPHDALWSRGVGGVLALAGVVSVLVPAGVIQGVAANIYVLFGSAALVLTLIEPFQRHGCKLSRAEERFRAAYVTGFALLAGVAVLGVWLDPAPIQIGCAVAGLVGATAAVAYRLGHPLETAATASVPRPTTEDDARLGARLQTLLDAEAIHTDPELRIGDVAARLGVPEHRLSRAVTALGFANFNRLINHHRIEQAKRMLTAPGDPRPILLIALDCGFASVGPFNRAFKAQTGMTPRAYRAASDGQSTAAASS